MKWFSIRLFLILGSIWLILIWGTIFFLAWKDPSYKLFVPKMAFSKPLASSKQNQIDFSQSGPWKSDLFMSTGDDLTTFSGKSFLQNGIATPSAVLEKNQIFAYFNYFPKNQASELGRVYTITSSDNGRHWTQPQLVIFSNMPSIEKPPQKPVAIVLPNGKTKLYFIAKKAGDSTNKLYAAVSDDGIHFVFDSETHFEIENENLISFGVAIDDGRMHLMAYTSEGQKDNVVYHAISYDSQIFTRLADVKINDSYYGQGYLVEDHSKLVLFGSSDKGMWLSNSDDGNSWSAPDYVGVKGQNPAAIQTANGYLFLYSDQTTAS